MTINDYFDHIYCINLDRRLDKWEEVSQEFEKHGLAVQRVSAVDGNDMPNQPEDWGINNAMKGCNLSHVKCLQDMINNGYKRVLILEDDVQFCDDLQQLFRHQNSFLLKWDMLYLGINHQAPALKIYGLNGLKRVSKGFTTHAYGIALEFAKQIVDKVEQTNDLVVDQVYAEAHPNYFCYCFSPQLAIQRPGHSDIRNEYVDYTEHFKK